MIDPTNLTAAIDAVHAESGTPVAREDRVKLALELLAAKEASEGLAA